MVFETIATLQDCTYFFRMVLLVAFIFPLAYMLLILIPFPVVVALLFAYFRPYKNNFFNIIDCLAFSVILALTVFFGMYGMKVASGAIQVVYVLMLIPCLYFLSFILYKVFSRVTLFHTC